MSRKTIYGTSFKEINFVPLQSATFCVQCELISTGTTPYCLACGNSSLLSLSRVLGGSLRHQQTAHLITDSELDSLVRDLLRTVPDPRFLNIAEDHIRVRPLAVLGGDRRDFLGRHGKLGEDKEDRRQISRKKAQKAQKKTDNRI